ncbi:OTU domain-containing protein 5 [Geodia barretti]|uniref:ubiquitinyl hydrolase 1 n=1 Tax=Geodia barretti TaxID=519541 RepID=A0AA35RRU4_GEOBA|nr:OTU domain-containing protein 5 [Geodia barretti]
MVIHRMKPDGACLFRAVADQVYGDQDMHSVVRNHTMDYMLKNADYFSQYVTEDFEQYVNRKRNDHSYGNNLEMQAMAEMYNRTIEVHQYSIGTYNFMVYTVRFRARGNYNALQTFPTQLLGVV